MKKYLLTLFMFMLTGCLGMPENLSPVTNFDGERYMGKWYEVARIDNRFERGMSNVTAEYTLLENNKISVVNRGFLDKEGEWKKAEGIAYFVDSAQEGYLKVSFFGPFYSSYVVFELGDDYDYAFVSGSDTDYLWLLSRYPSVTSKIKERFYAISKERGFDTNKIIWVNQVD
ncbi:lipocalin family protein [Vibrio sp. HN007]|uniref:lipocalin family protein n=1 Tax=Vibrio iocasae TaxID=3098914 RepID=UPI0035D42C85